MDISQKPSLFLMNCVTNIFFLLLENMCQHLCSHTTICELKRYHFSTVLQVTFKVYFYNPTDSSSLPTVTTQERQSVCMKFSHKISVILYFYFQSTHNTSVSWNFSWELLYFWVFVLCSALFLALFYILTLIFLPSFTLHLICPMLNFVQPCKTH